MRSFGTYVLLALFSRPLEPQSLRQTRGAVARALPRIDALTLALPAPDGPGSGGAEGFGVA